MSISLYPSPKISNPISKALSELTIYLLVKFPVCENVSEGEKRGRSKRHPIDYYRIK